MVTFSSSGNLGEDFECARLVHLARGLVGQVHAIGAFEPAIQPVERAGVERLRVLVRTFGDVQADVLFLAELCGRARACG